MLTFVLIHGFCHDGSSWDGVIKRLEQHGHVAYAPTLAGHGKNADKSVSHAQCTQSAIDYIVDRDLTDVILVGHGFRWIRHMQSRRDYPGPRSTPCVLRRDSATGWRVGIRSIAP